MLRIALESLVVGVMTVIVGSIVGYLLAKIVSVDLPKICKEWNKFHVMEISLFLTGVIIHLLCEVSGINKWYCKNGAACS
tara:strand:+ start:237 stop:476 length:240 start_codon:yes stop_codon:yes gene_type:complete